MSEKNRPTSLFFGTPDFALPSFEAALATTEVLGVVTQPDRPKGRGLEVQVCAVKARAQELGIPVFSPKSLRKASDELTALENFIQARGRPDFVLVTAYGNLLPQSYLDFAKIGPINVHASLLPRWRGAAPIQRAIEAGDPETGVCLQRMVMALDAGDVLAEKRVPITPELKSSTAFRHLSQLGGTLLREYLLGRPTEVRGAAQDEGSVTLAAKLSKEEGNYASHWSLAELHRRVCAFDPWPGVRARLEDGSEIRLNETKLLKASLTSGPLRIFRREQQIFIEDASGSLQLERVQFPSKPVQEAGIALRNFFDRRGSNEAPLLPL